MDHYKKASQEFANGYSLQYTAASSTGHFFRSRMKIIHKLLDACPKGKILDLGCGPGMMIDSLTARNFEYYGADLSNAMINECVKHAGNNKKVHLSVGKIEALPFPDDFFDVVLCMGAIEYVADVNVAFQEIKRVTKNNGTVIISMLNKISPFWLWTNLIKPNKTLINLYTNNQFQKIFLSKQLQIVESIYFDYNLFLWPLDNKFPRFQSYVTHRLEDFLPTWLQFFRQRIHYKSR